LPGSYGAGTAGNIIGNRIDAAITSRMATYTQPTGFLAATFPTTVASTTNITSATGITLAAVTHTGATIPTVTTVGSVSGSVGSVTGAVGSVTGAVGSVTGNVGGDVSGKVLGGGVSSITGDGVRAASVTGAVGSVTGAVTVGTVNANAINAAAIASSAITAAKFATDAIDANAVATSAVTEIQSGLSTLTAAGVENAVWDATMSSHTTATSYGGRILRAANSNVTAFLTGAQHIAADVHATQTGVFADSTYATGSTYAKLGTLIEADTPTGYHFTTQALEQAPSGGAGSWPLNTAQTTGLKRMISAVVGIGGETATPGVLEFGMVGDTTTLRITQSTDGNDRLNVEEV
jgi:hypothetical protein